MKFIIAENYLGNDETKVRTQVLWLLVQCDFYYAMPLLKVAFLSLTHLFIKYLLCITMCLTLWYICWDR